ncbi:MAG: peptidoglycan DD-metalloendopeptidase family protein [Candidatus Omnitrophica bacterium]|nr:peptidoglycan DD-metalloendopeptidase family protein [Candidatus Omnitrophota bacterium]MCM8777404.1 peptidoglycan DD-metalloendopeptidase family protein [Candidatus Omnitrophota bacterium]
MPNILRKIDVFLLLLLISGCSATIDTVKQKEIIKNTYHYVRQGENLFRISMYYYESKSTKEILEGVEKIKNANNIKTNSISVGQRLLIPHTVKKQPNYPLLPPSDITTTIKSSTTPVSPTTETKIEQPETPEYRPILIDRVFIWPVSGKIICNFGELDNQGIDILVEPGIDVLSADDGKIVFAGMTSKYQETIIIEHSQTVYTVYSHDLDILVQRGDYVRKGTPIAKVKSGTHRTRYIHFEIRINNVAVNPVVYLPQQ